MKDVYKRQSYIKAFDRFRQPKHRVIDQYINIIEEIVIKFNLVRGLDLGCGTGHFSIPLAAMIQKYDGCIVALDKSPEMLQMLKLKISENKLKNVQIKEADFMQTNLSDRYSFVWISDVIHVMNNLNVFIERVVNILQSDGYIFIRMSSHKQLKSYEWGSFFPEALEFDLNRHPDTHEVISSLVASGFSVFINMEIDESELMPSSEYLNFFKEKSLSSLNVMDSINFETLFLKMEKEFLKEKSVLRNAKTTLLVGKINE